MTVFILTRESGGEESPIEVITTVLNRAVHLAQTMDTKDLFICEYELGVVSDRPWRGLRPLNIYDHTGKLVPSYKG